MNLVDLLKKNIVMVPVVASVLVGTFTGVKYIVNLTDTINANQAEIQELKTMEVENIRRDMKVLTDGVNTVIAKLERAEGTWEMAENLYEVLADKVRQMEYDIKDLNREINYWMNYGDCQDELLLYRHTNHTANSISILCDSCIS